MIEVVRLLTNPVLIKSPAPRDHASGLGFGNGRSPITILGGGPAGLAVAFYANRAGIPFVLFERSAELGGLCRTFKSGAHSYDSGAHRFHDRDPEITADLRRIMGSELVSVDAPSRIYDDGRFIDFPPTPLDVIFSGIRLREAVSIGFDVLRSRYRKRPIRSFADMAVAQFGATLARRILLNYSEKLWGLPADRLSPDVATRRLQGMSLTSLLVELFLPSRRTSHIDGTFLYPIQGYGRIVERLQETLPSGSLRTGYEVQGLDCERGRIRRIRFNGAPAFEPAGRIVSTLPLTVLAGFLGNELSATALAAARELRFRQIRLFFIRLKRAQVSPNASIYIPDHKFCISRLYEPKNRSKAMAPEDETSLVAEAPCFEGDSVHSMTAEDLANRVIGELSELGIINRDEVIEWRHHMLRNAYPVYSLDYGRAVEVIRKDIAEIGNLDLIGRGGLFVYTHLHDQMRFGKDYVKELAEAQPAGVTAA